MKHSTIMHLSFRKIIIWITVLIFSVLSTSAGLVTALSSDQKALFDKNVLYYDLACSMQESAAAGEAADVVSGATKELAQQILDNKNITYWANEPQGARSDWKTSVPPKGNKTLIDTKDVVRALAQGRKAYTTAANAGNKTAEINPNILKFILEVGQSGNNIMVNALTDKTHSDDSNHYKGLAVDLDTGSAPLSVLNPIAQKYGGVKNSESGHHHYDFLERAEENESTPAPTSTKIDKVFMVGNSITYTAIQAPHNMKQAFQRKGIDATISGTGGATVDSPGPNPNGDRMGGLEAINHYKNNIQNTDAVVVALGTNHFPGEFEGAINRMVDKIRSVNHSAPIFWVNTFTSASGGAYSASASDSKNNILNKESDKLDFQVIDITGVGINLNSDGIHPDYNESGIGKWRDAVIEEVANGASSESSAPAAGNCACPSGQLVALSGNNNEAKALSFFVSQGFTIEVAAGIIGNFIEESGLNPKIVEYGWGFPEESDTVPPSVGPAGQPGYGIAQWTTPSRKEGLKDFAREKDMPVSDLALQLMWVMEEMKNYSGLKEALMNIKGTGRPAVEEAALLFHRIYEGSADGPEQIQERVDSGVKAMTENASSVGAGGGSDLSGGGGCGDSAGIAGEVIDGIAWPVPKKWWDDHPEYFTGPHHDYAAVDIAVPTGTEVFSMLDGNVVSVESSGACGGGVIIDSSGGIRITYCHGPPESVKVKAGDKVTAGQQIMSSNDTGSSTGPHLHIQIDVNGSKVCPQDIFKNLAQGKGTDIQNLPTSGCVG